MKHPEWEIAKRDYFERLECSEQEFFENLSPLRLRSVERIIPVKDLVKINSIAPIPIKFLTKLLRRTKTLDGSLPFKKAWFEFTIIQPSQLMVGQKFVYRENYQTLLEELPSLFKSFAVPSGIAQLGAYFMSGEDLNGRTSLACYLPPLLEEHERIAIMDGIHRDYTVKQIGTTTTAILAHNVNVPFPCELHPWSDVRVISLKEKPADMNERYFELRKELFRDLKYLGIDG